MPLELSGKELVPIQKAFRHFGIHKHRSTYQRWITKVICGGLRVEAVRFGGEWFTSRQAVERFLLASNPQIRSPQRSAELSVGSRKRADDVAEKLHRHGVLAQMPGLPKPRSGNG